MGWFDKLTMSGTTIPLILSLSKDRVKVVRQAHHERVVHLSRG